MKQMSLRALLMLFLSALFIIGLAVFAIVYVADADDWALYPANGHLYSNGQIVRAGSITDRNGTILAQTQDGKRQYNDSLSIRKATLHAVGDLDGYIQTGMHKAFLSQLTGYSKIDGVFQMTGEGNDLKLTLDADVCTAALKALGSYSGTVAAYNYKTGEVICMVSTPTYDVESESDSKKAKDGAYPGVYLNRFLSATYPPGSTFKIVTAAAAINTFPDAYTRSYTCKGGVTIDGEFVSCMGYHGDITLEQAFAKSCNGYFTQLAIDLGADTLTEYAEKMGFNQSFSMDGIKAVTSHLDLSNTRDIDLGWAGMGQYTDMMNPLQYLTMVGAIANGGVPVKPYMVDKVVSPLGLSVYSGKGVNGSRMLSKDAAASVAGLMDYAVEHNYGKWSFPGLDVCGKTGTAEVGEHATPHAEFIGFTTDEDLPLAFLVVVENGGAGSVTATRVANQMLQAARNVVFD